MFLLWSKLKILKQPRMMISILIFSAFWTPMSSIAQPISSLKTSLNNVQKETLPSDFQWKYRVLSEQNKTDLENSFLLYTHFDLEYSKKINPYLNVLLRPSVNFESGQISTYKSEKASDSALELTTAYVELGNISISSKLGLLQPKNYTSEQIFGSKNLIAMNFQYKFSGIALQQLISILPSSVNTLKTSDSNNNSTLSISQFQWDYRISELSSILHAGYFAFNDLNSGVANDASLTGNSTVLKNNVENQFIYQYAGLFLDVKMDLNIMEKWKTGLRYSTAKNDKAPEGLNTGHSLSLYNTVNYKKTNIILQNNFFRVEPDSILSSITHPYFFQNNKIGYSHGIWIQPHQQNMKFGIGSGAQQLLYQNSLQSAETFYWISMESEYANF